MSTRHDLLELEREAWRALSTDGETAAGHYEKLLAEDVLMLLPGGLVIDDRQECLPARLPGRLIESASAATRSAGSDAFLSLSAGRRAVRGAPLR